VDALRAADVIACEDTRRTRALLSHAGIPTPRLVVVNERTEPAEAPRLLRRAAEGGRIAVVSDAGMPGISDPGERLVAGAVDAAAWLAGREPRGEYSLVLEGAPPPADATESEIEAALRSELAAGVTKRDAVSAVAAALEVPRRRVYDLATRLG